MYNVTQAFIDAVKQNGRQFKSSVTIRDTTFDDNSIIDIDLEENVNPTESYMLGGVGSSKLEVTLISVPDTLILEDANVTATISLLVNGVYEDVPLGVFTVDDVSKDKNVVKLSCYDNMIKLEKAYFSDLSYPTDINNVANEICTKAGVQLATALPNIQINKIDGYTFREAIGFIASFLGGFARFNRLGKLEIMSYTDSGISITDDNYSKLTTNEQLFTIGKLTCKVGDSILTAGTNGNEIQFENPIMTQTQLDSIYNTLKNLSYMPFNMESWQGNQALQAGDKITITDVKGNTYNTLLMDNKITYKGGLGGSTSAVGKTATGQDFSSSGTMKSSIDRMVIEQANIKVLLADKATIEDLTATNAKIDNLSGTYATIVNLNAATARITTLETTTAHITNGIIDNAKIDIANINNLSATYATITDLNAANARIDTANINIASINTLLAGNVGANNLAAGAIQAGSAVIANSAISSAQIISLDVAKVNAGDISTTKFRVVSDAGNLLISDNTIQIKDASRVRVQIGKDASNDYNMYVWDASGNIMFDALGLKANGIKDKIIRDDMVSDTANIDAKKLNITTLFSQMNGSTQTLKATKIYLDTQAQTLDAAFTSLNSTVTSQGSTITSQGTSISTIQGQITSKIWSTDISNYVSSRGQNLVTNGTGLLGNNTNFSSMAFDSSDSYGSGGSFKDSGYSSVRNIDEFIPVNPDLNYRFSFYAKTNPNVGAHYYGTVTCYDTDKLVINPFNTMFVANTLTTLAQDLKPGDTKIYLANAVNWINSAGSSTWLRSLIVWNYKNSGGYLYPPLTYSRNYYGYDLWADGAVDFVNNCITLKTAWTGTTITTGTKVSNGSSGGSYKYCTNCVNTAIPSTWTQYTGTLGIIDISGTNLSNKFHPATAYVKIGWLNNRDVAGSTVWYSNISFGLDNAPQSALDTTNSNLSALTTRVTNAESSITQLNNSIVLKVDTTTYTTGLATKEGTITKSNTAPGSPTLNQLWLDTSVTPNVLKKYNGSSWDKATPTTASEVGAYSASQGSTLEGRMTTAESNITLNANNISLKVSSTDFNSYTSSNDSAVNSLTTRMSSAELKITDTAIVSTVRSSSAYVSDLGGKANTSDIGTLITQNASSVKVAVGQIGGNNLLKNTGNYFDLNHWILSQSPSVATMTIGNGNDAGVPTTYIYFSKTVSGGNWCLLANDSLNSYKFSTSKKYTFSIYFYVSVATTLTTQISDGDSTNSVLSVTNNVSSGYQKLSFTFTPASIGNLPQLRFWCGADIYNLAIVNCKLEEGENATAWSPNANELKNSSFEVTDVHARFTSSDGSYTEFVPGSTGLKWYNAVTNHSYHYLMASGTATVAYGSDVIVQLGDEFKNKDFMVITSVKATLNDTGLSTLINVGAFGAVESKANGTVRISGLCSIMTVDSAGNYVSSNLYKSLTVSYLVIG